MFQRFYFSEPNYNPNGQILNRSPVILAETAIGFFGNFEIVNFVSIYGTPRTGKETKPVSISVSVFMSY